jgi:hypothetical protein
LYYQSNQNTHIMQAVTTLTVAEIREMLYYSNKYAVIGADEMSNDDARRFLFDMPNQDATMRILDNGSHFLIW